MENFIPALLGFIAGVAGSIIAPWVNWGIEKRREKLAHRRALMKSWRKLIYDVSEYKTSQDEETEYMVFRELIHRHPAFYDLSPHLENSTIEAIDACGRTFWSHADVVTAFKLLVQDIDALEKEWGLI